MSAETKKAAENAGKQLKRASEYIESATEFAKVSGDKQLVEKVIKINKEVTETHQEIDKKTKQG
jgi:hypothetical protein